jgi:ketosteroid isomerase-like protein
MSEANVEIVKRAIDALERRDVEALADLNTADFELFPAMEGGSLRGREGLETFLRNLREAWEEEHYIADEFRDLGDRVLWLGRMEGRGRSSGVEVDAPVGAILDFRDGKIARIRTYFDHSEAVRAGGLAE